MSEQENKEIVKKFNKTFCPCCNNQLNFKYKGKVNYKISEADCEVWCRLCQRWIKFSLDTN